MFRQILVDKRDCDLQRIIWRPLSHEELQVFRLRTVTYGTSSAPFLAKICLLYLADLYESQFQCAAYAIRSNKYVDDFLLGAHSVEAALQLQNELVKMLALAGFSLGKWAAISYLKVKLPQQLQGPSVSRNECQH